MPLPQQLARDYLTFRKNPDMASYRALTGIIDEVKKIVREEFERAIAEARKEMRDETDMTRESFKKEIKATMQSSYVEYLKKTIPHIKGEKGDSIIGPTGLMGPKPIMGIDYKIPKEGKDGIDGKDGERGKDGSKGERGSPDNAEQIADKLNTLTQAIDRSVIKGLDTFLINLQRSIKEKRAQFGGGGGGGTVTVKTPAETPDSVRTEFTVTSEPIEVVADGITYFANNGYTYANGKIIMSIPPTNYIRYKV